ncbi:hypothetical protein SNOG_10395 [Parastagonospora nodorum SN15]|uniref:Uncharacterized protein n=1 Tax=Phaeosphaeria nodorum (strain SN15 / ATCC MYA-4574 / FGSC 10173) TaxID=321614 RepID=Q0UCW9_PHANO|nr:hypothetical protein SNOG_10395 [Parastagonospora nodorum SN15]EAT81789.1 hypothetical protein SNOG_10395 [Parastagonospora nodorum SN15]
MSMSRVYKHGLSSTAIDPSNSFVVLKGKGPSQKPGIQAWAAKVAKNK